MLRKHERTKFEMNLAILIIHADVKYFDKCSFSRRLRIVNRILPELAKVKESKGNKCYLRTYRLKAALTPARGSRDWTPTVSASFYSVFKEDE